MALRSGQGNGRMESQAGRTESSDGVVHNGKWKGKNVCSGIVGHAMRACCLLSLYGYAHPRRKVREVSRIFRVTPSLVAFDGLIDKG